MSRTRFLHPDPNHNAFVCAQVAHDPVRSRAATGSAGSHRIVRNLSTDKSIVVWVRVKKSGPRHFKRKRTLLSPSPRPSPPGEGEPGHATRIHFRCDPVTLKTSSLEIHQEKGDSFARKPVNCLRSPSFWWWPCATSAPATGPWPPRVLRQAL